MERISEHMKNSIKKKIASYGVVILFFAAFFLYGLMVVKDYGISTDELIERESSLITYKYIMPSVSDVVTETVNFPELTPLKEYKDRYYGMAVQIPAVVVEHLFGFQLDIRKVFLMRHLYNFLMYFAATVFFYKICRKLGHGKYMSLLGTGILILTPRILAESFYNIKDMMFLSVFVIALYFGLLCMENFSWKRLIPFAFFGALCTNVRIVGAMVVAVCLILAFIRSIGEKKWKKTFFYCWGTAILCFAFYFVMTPVIWENTWQEILNLIDTFSNYVVWYAYTFFMGQYVLSTELPWYYLFVNIGIMTPIFYLLMFFCGAGALAARGVKGVMHRHGPKETDWYYIGLAVNLIVPFVYVLVSRPVLYNGWRHFYFVYPMMVLVMLYGIAVIWQAAAARKKAALRVCQGVTGAAVLGAAVWIGLNHPYEYCFFNRIALPFVDDYFQKDYWNVSHYDLLRYACEQDGREQIKVWILPENTITFMPPEHRNRLVHVDNQDDADYIVTAYTQSYEDERLNQYYLYDEMKAVWVDGIKFSSLFRRAYDPSLRCVLEESQDTLRYDVSGMEWEISRDGDRTVLHGSSREPVSLDKIYLQGSDGQLMEEMEVLVSEDGVNYTELELTREFDSVDTDRSGFCEGMEVTDIIIRHKAAEEAELSVVFLSGRELGEEAAPAMSVIEDAETSDRQEEAYLAYDGNLETRWTSGTAQTEGMYYEIMLKDSVTISGLTLDSYTSPGDEGKNLTILCSADGQEWIETDASTEDNIHYSFSPAECRYIRLEAGAVDADSYNNWSIHEIGLVAETEVGQ